MANEIIELPDIEELKDLKLTGVELRYVLAYLSPQCNFDNRKAMRVVTPDDEFAKLAKATFAARAMSMARKPQVQQAISRLMSKEVERKKEEILPVLVRDLILAATYDPAEIIDDDGDLLHGTLRNVPTHLRSSVVEGITVKYWGKECNIRTREVKLASKSKARTELASLVRTLAQLDVKVDDGTATQFVVNIGSSNIDGMATAKDLFKMATAKKVVKDVEDDSKV